MKDGYSAWAANQLNTNAITQIRDHCRTVLRYATQADLGSNARYDFEMVEMVEMGLTGILGLQTPPADKVPSGKVSK